MNEATKQRRLAAYRKFAKENPGYTKERWAQWYAKNKAVKRAYDRKRRGLPEPDYPAPLFCECCRKPFAAMRQPPCLDHNHHTGAFRGWLCVRCNSGIGLLGDDIAGMLTALRYLQDVEMLK
jgi:hypothetical protein